MVKDLTLTMTENFPEIDLNYEGLRRHSFLCAFVDEGAVLDIDLKNRNWLLHTLMSSARHYSRARELVILQKDEEQVKDGGAIFYILDVSEQIEDCILSTSKACMAIRRINSKNNKYKTFIDEHKATIDKLERIRNQFEHMHTQIVSGEVGNGPIMIILDDDQTIVYRRLRMEINLLYRLIKGLYYVIASLYPSFDVCSKPEAGGSMRLRIMATTTVIKNN